MIHPRLTPKPLFLIPPLGPNLSNNGINKNETFGGETIETFPKSKMSYVPEEHVYIGGLEFEMHFPMEKKKSKMVVRLKDQPTKVYADCNFIVVYFSM